MARLPPDVIVHTALLITPEQTQWTASGIPFNGGQVSDQRFYEESFSVSPNKCRSASVTATHLGLGSCVAVALRAKDLVSGWRGPVEFHLRLLGALISRVSVEPLLEDKWPTAESRSDALA